MTDPRIGAALLEATDDGVVAFDRALRYTAWNPAMERLTGVSAAQVLGRPAIEAFPFLLETGEAQCFHEALAGRAVVSRVRPFRVPETGRSGLFEARYQPIRDDRGEVIGGLAIVRDVASRDAEETFKLHRRVLESMREGVSVCDEQGVILYTNPAEDAMFGYAPGELVGQHVTVQNAYPPEENARRVAEVLETLKRDGVWVGEWRNRRKDGGTFVTRARITGIEAGGRQLWVCVQEDVTRELEALAAMRRSAEDLAFALQAARLGDWQWDAATDLVTFGERGAEIFGVAPGPSTTWTGLRELLHPDDRERARLEVERAIAERGHYDIEYRVLRPSGEAVWVAAKGRAVYDAADQVRGMIGIVQDVTERKRAEQALLDETRALETLHRVGQLVAGELDQQKLVQALTDAGTAICGAQFGAFFYNAIDPSGDKYMLYTLSGVPAEAFSKFPMPRNTPLFGPTFRGEAVVRIDDVLADPRYGQNPPHRGMPPGHLPVRSYLAVPVVSRSGEVLGGLFFGHAEIGMFTARHERLLTSIAAQAAVALDSARLYQQARDAEQRAHERAAALALADRRKDQFLAMLAHELRNPLGGLSNALHVMSLTAPDDARFVRAREVAHRQLLQQTRLVDDLLDVSRIARGKVRLQVEPVDLVEVVRQAAADHAIALEDAGVALALELPDRPVRLEGDRVRLLQVVGNLLDNARKFTPRGGRVTVRLTREEGRARIEVADTGVGIDAGVLPDLFTPFAQADRTLDRSQGGLGLGLALVKGLVELHPGGRVAVASPGPGEGTTFTLWFDTAADAPAREVPANGEAPRGRLRVLVIEDLADLADTLAVLLELHGHAPRVAQNGAEGIALARELRPDVVLCDIGLPGGASGYDVARALRADPATAGLRLVALSGYGAEEDLQQSRAAGFDRHLTKPVQPEDLLALLGELTGAA